MSVATDAMIRDWHRTRMRFLALCYDPSPLLLCVGSLSMPLSPFTLFCRSPFLAVLCLFLCQRE